MIERIVDHENYLVRLPANPKSEDAILFLHGFPSNKGVKNLDVALYARDELNLHVLLTFTLLGPNVRHERHATAPQALTKRANTARRCVSARWSG